MRDDGGRIHCQESFFKSAYLRFQCRLLLFMLIEVAGDFFLISLD
jgi:hypothetical protein